MKYNAHKLLLTFQETVCALFAMHLNVQYYLFDIVGIFSYKSQKQYLYIDCIKYPKYCMKIVDLLNVLFLYSSLFELSMSSNKQKTIVT